MPIRKKYRTSLSINKKRVIRRKRSFLKLPKITKRKRLIKKRVSPSLFRRFFRIKNKKRRGIIKWLNFILKLFLFSFLLGLFGIIGVFIYFSKDIPNPDKIIDRSVAESTKIYDRTGKHLLYEIHGEEKRTIINLDQVSEHLVNATIATEDQDFYQHHGVDFRGIVRAIYKNVISGEKLQGGSTITQQLIKNSILTSERTFTRKIKEIILAIETERRFSKDEILEMYLNQIPYGSNAYGIESASKTFFEKSAKNLSVSEAALLAGLPNATTYYSPYGAHPEALEYRYQHIINQMQKEGYLNEEEAERERNVEILKQIKPFREDIKAPHFVMYIKQQLVDEFGEERIKKGGLKIITSLDYEMQLIAEDVVRTGAEINAKNYNAKNAALVAIDPKTGQILVMVGSKDYFNVEDDGNVNVAISPYRQPGSSFKPFVYAAALNQGYTPNTILFDVQTNFGKDGSGKEYIPQNYNYQFSGPVTIRESLARSLNIPAVKTLYLAGIDNSVQMARNLGITTLRDSDKYGLSLVLGTGEVKLLDMVSAYGVFANDGVKNSQTTILKIEDADGKILKDFKSNSRQVLEKEIARNISSILSDNIARIKTFGSKSKLYLGERPVAAKTGTTNDYKDGWTIGYTPSLVAGVWAGNNKGEKMKRGGGITVAAPIWNEFMSRVLEASPFEEFQSPKEIKTGKAVLDGYYKNEVVVKIDKACDNKLASELTPESQIEEKIYLEVHNILNYIDRVNPQGAVPENPEEDSNFVNWETGVLGWATENAEEVNIIPPTEICSVREDSKMPLLKVFSPQNNQIIKNSKLAIKVEAFTVFGLKQIDFYFDDILIGVGKKSFYEVSYNLPDSIKEGLHMVTIKGYDQVENSVQKEILVIVSNDNTSLYLKPILETDFPFIINIATSGNDVQKVDFYYQLDSIYDADLNLIKKTGLKHKISSVRYAIPGEDNLYQILWEEDKKYFISGKYKIFAIMEDGGGKIYESNKRYLEIK